MDLTQEQITAMPAGPHLTGHVAEIVMGHLHGRKLAEPNFVVDRGQPIWIPLSEREGVFTCLYYSEEMNAAWRVVERMNELFEAGKAGPWWPNFWHSGIQQPPIWELPAKEAAAAICRAALIAMLPRKGLVEAFAEMQPFFKDADFSILNED